MKIAFVEPPRLASGNFVQAEECCWGKTKKLVLPYLLLACATHARNSGHDAAFFDLAIDEPDVLSGFDVVVHSLPWHYAKEVNRAMEKPCNGIPRIIIAIPPGYQNDYAEMTGCQVIASSCPESYFGRVIGEEGPYDFENSSIDYSLIHKHYLDKYGSSVYQVTRGCPYRCRFCVWGGSTVTSREHRIKDADVVADDIHWLHELSGLHIYLISSQLSYDGEWIEHFHFAMHDNPVRFQSNVNVADVDLDKLRMLAECGMHRTSVGVESTGNEILRIMRKPFFFDKVLRGLRAIDESGMPCGVHIRYGVGENSEQVQEALDNLRVLTKELDGSRFNWDMGHMIHYKGTEILDKCNYGLVPSREYEAECFVSRCWPINKWAEYANELNRVGWLSRIGLPK